MKYVGDRKRAQCGKRMARQRSRRVVICEVKLKTKANSLGGREDRECMSKMRARKRKAAASQHHLPIHTLQKKYNGGDWMWSRETKGQ